MSADDATPPAQPRLGEIGLNNFPPYLMNRIMGRYNATLREQMGAMGLSTPQMRALAVLSVIDGILIRELAVYAVIEQSTLSRALERLVADGFVRREVDEADSRAARLYLTEEGRSAYERLWPHMKASHDRMFAGIDQAERQAFVTTLQKILRNVRVHDF